MNTVTTVVTRAADALVTFCFAGFFLAVLAQIAYRYLGINLVFSEELARLLNLYVVFLGLVIVTVRHGHIRIDLLDRLLGRNRLTDILYRFQLLAAFVFLCAMTLGAYRLMVANWPYPLATMPWVSQGTIYLAPFIGGAAATVITAVNFLTPGRSDLNYNSDSMEA
ncbi:TRAP transporter small permease subunit [Aurantimonas sp. A2-1-M11]|uniref:TRAP transporter small permease n=1 Tax=Aurantimonas sp. A2-1-M11 TaxID=3113712 RepID=UPI002F94C071